MESLLTQELYREIENDRLRMAGYRTRVERRQRERGKGLRRSVGNGLISVGERVRGYATQPMATAASSRRA